MEENAPETREALMMNKVLLKPSKETFAPTQRKSLFRNVCKARGKCCKVVIDSGSIEIVVSTEMVEKIGLKRHKHSTPYKMSWLEKGHQNHSRDS